MTTLNSNFSLRPSSPLPASAPTQSPSAPLTTPVAFPAQVPAEPSPEAQDLDAVQQRSRSASFSRSDVSFEGLSQSPASSTPTPIPRVDSLAPQGQDIDIEKTMKSTRRRVQIDLARFQVRGMDYPTSVEQSAAVDFGMNDRGLSTSDTDAARRTVHQAVLADTILSEQGGEGYTSLSSEQKATVLKTLMLSDFRDLFTPETQGAGGGAAGAGTVSGEQGHYVNSEMASVVQLAQDKQLTPAFLDALSQLSTGELDPQLAAERTDLISSTLQNVAFPERINQHAKGTCAATVPEIMFATHDPAQYVALVAQLATPTGDAVLPTGTEMHRGAGTESLDNSGRSIASRLIQPAFMEYANGDRTYDNSPDQGLHSDGGVGLPQAEVSDLIKGLFGDEGVEQTLSTGGWTGTTQSSKADLLETLSSKVNNGHPTPVGIRWGEASHELLLTKMDDDFAYTMNPHGALHKMPRDEFDERLIQASIPADGFELNLPAAATQAERYVEIEPAKYMTTEEYASTELRNDVIEFAQRLSPEEPELLQEIEAAIDRLDSDGLNALIRQLSPFVMNRENGIAVEEDQQLLKANIREIIALP